VIDPASIADAPIAARELRIPTEQTSRTASEETRMKRSLVVSNRLRFTLLERIRRSTSCRAREKSPFRATSNMGGSRVLRARRPLPHGVKRSKSACMMV
jgi:hypothetical protein